MQVLDSKKKEEKKSITKMIYPDLAYFTTQFIGKNKLNQWLRDVWNKAVSIYPTFFEEGSEPDFVLTLLPISLINLAKEANIQRKGLSPSMSYIETRASIELYRILDEKFPEDQGSNKRVHHENSRNREILYELILKLLTPDRRKTTSSLFKLLSGYANFHTTSIPFVHVLAGRHPDGSLTRERAFIVPGTSEKDVAVERKKMIEERRLTPYGTLDMTYFLPDLEQMKHIVSYMTNDHSGNLASIGVIVDSSELIVRFLVDRIKGLYGNEGDEFNAETFKEDFDAFNKDQGDFTLIGVGGKSISTAEGAIQKATIEYINDLDVHVKKYLDGEVQGTIVVGYVVNMVHHHLLASLHLRTDERRKLVNFLQMRGPIIAALTAKFGTNPTMDPRPESFVIPTKKFSAFTKDGSEEVRSYIYRLKVFSQKNNLEIALIENVLKKYSSRIDTGDFDIPAGYIFNVNHLLETTNKVLGTAFTPQESGFGTLYAHIDMMETTMRDGLEEVERDLDEKFGESRVIPAMVLPQLTLKDMDNETSWVDAMMKKFRRDIYEKLPSDIYEQEAKDDLVNSMVEAVSVGSKLSEVEEFYSLNIKTSHLEDIEDRIRFINDLGATNFAPKFNDFEYEPKDGVGYTMEFDISGKTLIINGKKVSVDKIFYKDDGVVVSKFAGDSKRALKPGGDEILRNYFDPMFRRFITIGIEAFNISFAQEAIDEHNRVRYRTHMTVNCASQEDVYKITKFRTIFETASIEDILDANPDFGDSYAITPDYIIYWKKTDIQQATIAGNKNENTFKFYEKSDACALQYPFYDGRFKANSVKVLSDYNFKVHRVYEHKPSGPGTSVPGPKDFGELVPGTISDTVASSAAAWQIHTAGLRPEEKPEEKPEENQSQDVRNQDRNLIARHPKPRGFQGGKTSGNRYQQKANNSSSRFASGDRQYNSFAHLDEQQDLPTKTGSSSSVRIQEDVRQFNPITEEEAQGFITVRGRKFLTKDIRAAKTREMRAGATPSKLASVSNSRPGQHSGGYNKGGKSGHNSGTKHGSRSSEKIAHTASPGRGMSSGERQKGATSPAVRSITSFKSHESGRSRPNSPAQVYPGMKQDSRQTVVTVGLVATGKRMVDDQIDHFNALPDIQAITLNEDNQDDELDF